MVREAQQVGRVLRCPWHGWTYDLTGALKGTPDFAEPGAHDVGALDREHHGLIPVRMARWFDLLFVNLDGKAAPLDEHLQPLNQRFEAFDFSRWRFASSWSVTLLIVPMQHQYLVTERLAELDRSETPIPLFRECDESFYLRQEGVGLLVGPYEDKPSPWSVEATPPDFGMELLPPDLDRVSPTLEKAMRRVPALAALGIKTTVNGAITFTADGHPLIGPAPAARNYYLFTGFNAGIMEGGGAGWMLAEHGRRHRADS